VFTLIDCFIVLVFWVCFNGSNIGADILLREGTARYVYLLLMSVGLIFAAKKLKRMLEKSTYTKNLALSIPLWGKGLSVFLLWLCVLYFQRVYWSGISEQLLLGWIVLLLAFIFVGGAAATQSMAQKEIEWKNAMDNKLETLENSYQELLRRQREKSALFHDVKNHIAVVQGMIEEDEKELALQYLQQIVGEFRRCENKIWANHPVLDLILNEKFQEACRRKIRMEIECENMSEMELSSIDICVLFFNVLDNAIEANLKLDEELRWIQLFCKRQKSMMILSVNNPTDQELNLKNGIPETTKDDKANHGFGMYSIQRILQKNGGHMDVYNKDGIFHIIIGMMSFAK